MPVGSAEGVADGRGTTTVVGTGVAALVGDGVGVRVCVAVDVVAVDVALGVAVPVGDGAGVLVAARVTTAVAGTVGTGRTSFARPPPPKMRAAAIALPPRRTIAPLMAAIAATFGPAGRGLTRAVSWRTGSRPARCGGRGIGRGERMTTAGAAAPIIGGKGRRANAEPNALALWNRSAGERASALANSASRAGEAPAASARNGGAADANR